MYILKADRPQSWMFISESIMDGKMSSTRKTLHLFSIFETSGVPVRIDATFTPMVCMSFYCRSPSTVFTILRNRPSFNIVSKKE